jgi:hypothetical protein
VYAEPAGRAIELDFGSAATDDNGGVVAYEDAWPGIHVSGSDTDPRPFYEADISNDADSGKSICMISGAPALCVDPAKSGARANDVSPLVQLVYGDALVQLSGADLDTLVRVAATLHPASGG